MPFPLSEWIDDHAECRHNLAKSGMYGAIPAPVPAPAEVRSADPVDLRRRLAEDLGVDAGRVFLTTGASQANALALLFLALARRRRAGASGVCRVCLPEYPPMFDAASWAGFRIRNDASDAEVAVISQPRNPEGDVWDVSRLLEWASGARSVVVDETFREFAGVRSVLAAERPGLWTTGSFTKFFAGDDLRLGFAVAPEESVAEFGRFHGVVTNLLSPYAVAGATRALRERASTRRRVRAILRANLAALRSGLPNLRTPKAPVVFDRPESGETGDALAARALRASVLVCSGSFFGDGSGVRLCLTRPSFPADLAAYLAVRARAQRRPVRAAGGVRAPGRSARRPPSGTVRGKAAPS
jgi:histidinol-phosphate/aromatic aminotransferase/cobyric acid decarboxylase-like protein